MAANKTRYYKDLEMLMEEYKTCYGDCAGDRTIHKLSLLIAMFESSEMFEKIGQKLKNNLIIDIDRDVDYVKWSNLETWMETKSKTNQHASSLTYESLSMDKSLFANSMADMLPPVPETSSDDNNKKQFDGLTYTERDKFKTTINNLMNNNVFNDKVLDTAIIEKADNGYMVEFNGEELLIKSEDVSEVYAKENTTAVESTSVPVTVYHFIYLEGDSSCNESICHPESQIKEQFNYLRENNFFTMNTTELGKFIDGKIRVPEKSILITIDDGARAWNFIPILEEYKINATLFLISGWYPLDKFSSPYLEVASHTHDLHHGGQCPGGQGSPLKCKPKEELLADLRTSREVLRGTKAFCFPFYEYNGYAVSVLKEAGFEMAFIGGGVKATKGIDKFHIPRISLNRWTSLSQYARYVN